jgi:hypothetical protein
MQEMIGVTVGEIVRREQADVRIFSICEKCWEKLITIKTLVDEQVENKSSSAISGTA